MVENFCPQICVLLSLFFLICLFLTSNMKGNLIATASSNILKNAVFPCGVEEFD